MISVKRSTYYAYVERSIDYFSDIERSADWLHRCHSIINERAKIVAFTDQLTV